MLRQSIQVRFPFKLSLSSGSPATGVLPANITDGATPGNLTIVKSDGTVVSVALTNTVTFWEVSSTAAPGLYHVLLSTSHTSLIGPFQVYIQAVSSAFVPTTIMTYVESTGASADLTKNMTCGRWKIFSSGGGINTMVVYAADGTTILQTYNLKDSAGSPTFANPFERVPTLAY